MAPDASDRWHDAKLAWLHAAPRLLRFLGNMASVRVEVGPHEPAPDDPQGLLGGRRLLLASEMPLDDLRAIGRAAQRYDGSVSWGPSLAECEPLKRLADL